MTYKQEDYNPIEALKYDQVSENLPFWRNTVLHTVVYIPCISKHSVTVFLQTLEMAGQINEEWTICTETKRKKMSR